MASDVLENGPQIWADALCWPQDDGHKYTRGAVGVVTGPLGSTGAARLAARAALRAGAGAVTLLCPPDALASISTAVTSPMTEAFAGANDLAGKSERFASVIIGPAAGVTPETRANVAALAEAGRKLVLDADALTVFRGEASALKALLEADAVLTPHAAEFERLFPGLRTSAASPLEAAQTAAKDIDAVLLLKGAETVIAAPDGRAAVNRHATPFLATAGSGDVLAGIIGGLLAQGLEPFMAACAGVWMHGDAGRRAGPGMISEDLDAALRDTVRALYEARK